VNHLKDFNVLLLEHEPQFEDVYSRSVPTVNVSS